MKFQKKRLSLLACNQGLNGTLIAATVPALSAIFPLNIHKRSSRKKALGLMACNQGLLLGL